MDVNHIYWEENSNIQHLKYESCNSNDGEHPKLKDDPLYRCCDINLNFATVACSEDDSEYGQFKKNKVSRDPMSHRIIEKRRRDRMNNCLADLSRLIPAEYLRKGRGRIEKTEIIEMAIRHIKYLQQAHQGNGHEEFELANGHEQYRLGYQECMSETMRFLVEVEGYFAREALCVRLINHLQKHCDAIILRNHVTNKINAKNQMEKEYSPVISSSVPPINVIAPMATVNSTKIMQPQSPLSNPIQEQYDNASQLRDMLTANIIKDQVRMSATPQIVRPLSRDGVPSIKLARIPTPELEKLVAPQFKPVVSKMGNMDCKKFENEKNNNTHIYPPEKSHMERERARTLSENYPTYSNEVSLYKFKNNIKQRFSQDLNAETNCQTKIFKRRKLQESTRRISVTETYSSENHSSPADSSQCSPPSSEMYRISSESENARISPTGSFISDGKQSNHFLHSKPEINYDSKTTNEYEHCTPTSNNKNNLIVSQSIDMEKENFRVPIFALHAKGSFYIPLTIDYHTLVPYLQHNNILNMLPNVHNIILHPVTINVNFQSNYFINANNNPSVIETNKHKIEGENGWH